MQQDGRVLKSPPPTLAAVQYHSERVKAKCSDPPVSHDEILGAAVDNHRRNMSFLTSSLLRSNDVPSVGSAVYREVEDFCAEDNFDLLSTSGSQQRATPGRTATSPFDPLGSAASLTPKMSAKKAAPELDPASLLHRMRSQGTFRSIRLLDPNRASNTVLDDLDAGDDVSIFKEASCNRVASFLARPNFQSAATDDMLAQIRGPKWAAAEGSKSVKSAPVVKANEVLPPAALRSESSASDGSGDPMYGIPIGSTKSFTSGKRPGAIPSVCVDAGPSPVVSPVSPARPRFSGSAGGGILSKLKKMVHY